MAAPFAAYGGYRARLQLALQGPSPQYLTLPANQWYFPQRLNSSPVYSSAGGVFPDVLPANVAPSDSAFSGTFRNDYNPFRQVPITIGQRVIATFVINADSTGDPEAFVKALVTMIDTRAMCDGQVSYVIGLRGMWQWISLSGQIPGH